MAPEKFDVAEHFKSLLRGQGSSKSIGLAAIETLMRCIENSRGHPLMFHACLVPFAQLPCSNRPTSQDYCRGVREKGATLRCLRQ
ncbi:unnamed protein product [Gongylonema pulchrum]|uniref:Uncharacterized protein n=1 Tax=Gongylonema pulchrum TaxID=637853 RepID=A0A183E5P8_9BILA|nr:unnamed protein product [Gongylonema pulchrum]